ncbi:MCM2/3/5 family-domain-containing protein [Baffinella frigidus]|nr:MCM2/3/5 family-domain-containing protein [Cryptophyta sp. CCMP2293]
MNYNNSKKILKEFFLRFSNENKNFRILNNKINKKINGYHNQIQNIIHRESRTFIFYLKDLKKIPCKIIKYHAFSNTKRFLQLLKDSIHDIINDLIFTVIYKSSDCNLKDTISIKSLDSEKKKFFFSFQIILVPYKNLPLLSIKKLNANLIGKFSYVRGRISIQNSTRLILTDAVYFCNICKIKINQKVNYEKFKPLLYCPSKFCRQKIVNNKVYLDLSLSFFEKYQEITIKEEQEIHGKVKQNLKIQLQGEFVQNFKIGELIQVAGILFPDDPKFSREPLEEKEVYLDAMYLYRKISFDKKLENKLSIRQKILEICKDSNFYSLISNSIAPNIYGNLDIKKAFLLSLVSSFSSKNSNSYNLKRYINILIFGNNGSGKSSLLKFMSDIRTTGLYLNSSFLIDSFETQFKEEKYAEKPFNLRNNSFLGLNKDLLCVDEIENFSHEKKKIFYEILEKQLCGEIKTSKQFNSSFTLIASSFDIQRNLIFQQSLEKKSENTDLYKKFDLCFSLNNSDVKNYDRKVANYITEKYKYQKKKTINNGLLEKKTLEAYLNEASKTRTFFPAKLFDVITYNYVISKVQETDGQIILSNVKYIFTIFRLSLSLAQLRFQLLVSESDVQEAIRLVELSKKNSYFSENKEGERKNSTTQNKIYNLIRNVSYREKILSLDLFSIEKLTLSHGYSRLDLIECLDFFESLSVWTISLTQGKIVFLV